MSDIRYFLTSRVIPLGIAGLILISIIIAANRDTTLEQVLKSGQLVMVTRNSPTTYYEGPSGLLGLEYDVAKRFADHLGVSLNIITTDNLQEMLNMVVFKDVHFAAAGLTITDERKKLVRFGESYQNVTQQIIYRLGSERPRKIEDLMDKQIEVIGNSSHAERLAELSREYPRLQYTENTELGSDDLMRLVWEQVIDYTVMDSNEFLMSRRFYPELRVAMDISDPQQLAWVFPYDKDDSLYNASINFIRQLKKSGEMQKLLSKYYSHVENFDYVGAHTFMFHIAERLPRYIELFKAAATEYSLDWELLAAIGYQESHWNPKARSPTGVRGIMMLTMNTAEYLGIENRLDPEQSIMGGAKFISTLSSRIPAAVKEPDRTWMTLAAYNIGRGHLEDARIITGTRGGDPDKWADVKDNLPLLARKKWYKRTKHGYARGWEPVNYVENIRSYYEILRWNTQKEADTEEPPAALSIDSPAL